MQRLRERDLPVFRKEASTMNFARQCRGFWYYIERRGTARLTKIKLFMFLPVVNINAHFKIAKYIPTCTLTYEGKWSPVVNILREYFATIDGKKQRHVGWGVCLMKSVLFHKQFLLQMRVSILIFLWRLETDWFHMILAKPRQDTLLGATEMSAKASWSRILKIWYYSL